jgi:hypothetical protein
MTFSRTKSGLNNYSKFYGVDITVFVEGGEHLKENSVAGIDFTFDTKTSDELFHKTIFATFSPKKRYKIKSIGSKTNVQSYAKNIISGGVKNCILIYDSDYECVLSSWVAPKWMFRTNGYSWENDLWSPSICEAVIELFCGGRPWDKEKFRNRLTSAAGRVKRLSKIELLCRLYGKNLIVPKSKSIGVELKYEDFFLISIKETNRLIRKIKETIKSDKDKILNLNLINYLKEFPPCNLIRGHLWEAVCITLIASTIRDSGEDSVLPANSLRNVALGLFKNDTKHHLSIPAQKHYADQIAAIGL